MALLCILSIATSCTKTGPAGAKGDTGPMGNANVVVDTFTLVSADWKYNSAWIYSTANNAYTEYFTRYSDRSFSKITQGMLDTGMVMVYFTPNQTDATQWVPLPYSFLSFGSTFYYNYAYETMPGKVRLHYWYTAASGTPPNTLSTDVIFTHRYKIVAVSGTISTALRRDHVDVGNYNALMDYLGK